MSIKYSACDATLTTSSAHVRSLARVVPVVDDQRRPLRKGFAALLARVLPFSSVDDIVGPQKRVTSEAFTAHRASIRFLTGMRPIVDLQTLSGL